jgi:hypothetical protein
MLQHAAELEVASDACDINVRIINNAGHKLPTGYPTRRMWLHVVALDRANRPVFESGATRDGAIVDGKGARLDGPGAIVPHRSALASPDQVVIYEAVPVDAQGRRTHLLLGTAKVIKDNRILPAGWRADHADAARTRPIGTAEDPGFVAGSDTVIVTLPATAHTVHVELLYQSIPPETLESYRPTDSREAARFLEIARPAPAPVTLARQTLAL